MIDFIFSTDENNADIQKFALRSTHTFENPRIITYKGIWGCLSIVGEPYPGFSPIETEDYILVVLGGPLPRYDYSVANGQSPDDGTQWILDRWMVEKRIRWDDDIIGHFAILLVEKQSNTVQVITDINSFVPIYADKTDGHNINVSSHPDALAIITNKLEDIDLVSAADFLKYGSVSFPYSLYHGITQLQPASEVIIKDERIMSSPYWTMDSVVMRDDKKESASLLRDTLRENIKRICAGQNKIGLLMSGGEDSRIVGSLAAEYAGVKAFTFVEEINREARVAARVARKLGMEWHPVIRGKDHYITHCQSSVLLSTSNNQFIHAHANGNIGNFPRGARILGGLMADGFFKCANCSSRYSGTGKFFIKDKMAWENRRVFINCPLPESLDKEVEKRKEENKKIISSMLPTTWLDWYWFFPSTTNASLTNLIINRRLFFTYEPFIDAKIIKLGLSIPTNWKVNGKFFRDAMHPILRKTRMILHSEGRWPYIKSPYINLMLQLFVKSFWKMIDMTRKLFGLPRRNRGPWPLWEDVIKDAYFQEKVADLQSSELKLREKLQPLHLDQRIQQGQVKEVLGAFQILTWARWLERVQSENV